MMFRLSHTCYLLSLTVRIMLDLIYREEVYGWLLIKSFWIAYKSNTPTLSIKCTKISSSNIQAVKQHESEKKAKYNDRILNVEKRNFTHLIFLTTGEMSPECKKILDRLAELYATKRNEQYHIVVWYI